MQLLLQHTPGAHYRAYIIIMVRFRGCCMTANHADITRKHEVILHHANN